MRRWGWPAAAILVAAATISAASPAVAATEISTDTETPVIAEFASPWLLELRIAATGEYAPAPDESSGTVAIFLDQLPGTFLENLVVQPDGRVFVSPPPDLPWLAPGDYNLRAVFTATPASGLDSTQAIFADAITIVPRELRATVDVETDPSLVTVPTITISLARTTDDELDSAPPGIWSVSVRAASDGTVVATRELAQSPEPDPIVVELDTSLRAGTEYVVTTSFTPVAEYAPGVVVTGTGEQSFTTASAGVGEFLVSPVLLPIWAVVLIGAGLLLALAALVVALVTRSRRQRDAASSDSGAHTGADHDADDDADQNAGGDSSDAGSSGQPEGASEDSRTATD